MRDIESYREGLINGLDIKHNFKFVILGHELDKLMEIVEEYEHRKFFDGIQWTTEQMEILKKRQKEINKMHEMTVEEAEAKLAKAHIPRDMDGSWYILKVLEALGFIKFKKAEELPPAMKAICAIMIETEVRQGPDYGKTTPGYPSAFGAGCLIDGLINKGFKIVSNDSRAKFKHAMRRHGYSEHSKGLENALDAFDSAFS